jgi:DNA-binding Lrp family transcriptional regulator
MMKLDSIDINILSNLQKNGRMPNVALARNAGISAPPCLRRLKHLEKTRVIRGYYAEIDRTALGYDFTALCLVTLNSQTSENINHFLSFVRNFDCIRTCISVAGEYDFVLKIVAKNFGEYDLFLNNKLQKHPSLNQVKTYIVMKQLKDEKGIPINSEI